MMEGEMKAFASVCPPGSVGLWESMAARRESALRLSRCLTLTEMDLCLPVALYNFCCLLGGDLP